MMNTRVLRLVVGALLIGGLVAAGGCQRAADEATERVIEGATGVDVESDENKVTIETEDGSISIQSEGAELPDGFPDDAPIYDAEIVSSSAVSTGGETIFSVAQETADEFDGVVSWYRDEFAAKGWTESGYTATDMGDAKAAFIGMSTGSSEVMINVSEESGGGVTVVISARVPG